MVLVEWEGWANSAEFAAMLESGVQALTDHHGSRWLADCRRQKVLRLTDQDWADREWLPRALAAGLKKFAVVLPDSGLAGMNLKDRLAGVADSKLGVGYFETVEQAREWLSH
jgi:hypothetical protein